MAAIRQISVLFLFVALICQYGQADERDKRHVGGLQNFFLKLLHPLDLAYLRYRQRFKPSRFAKTKFNDKIEFPDDIFTIWDDYEDSGEFDDYLSNPFEGDDGYLKNSKEDDCDDDKREKEYAEYVDGKPKGPKHKAPKLKPNDVKLNKNPYSYIFEDIEKLKRVIEKENSYNSPENFLLYLFKTYGFNQDTYNMYIALQSLFSPLSPADFVSNPGAPKTNPVPGFVPNIFPNLPINAPKHGALYTYPPNDILRKLILKINRPPFSDKPKDKTVFPDLNGSINDRFNPLPIPTNGFYGNKGRPNYIPIGGSIIDGYYPNPWQQMYYLVQLSNGQVVLVPKQAIFGPNKRPIAPGYGPIFLPNNNPIFGPGSYIPRIDYDGYPFSFNYGFDKGYGRGSRNLREPRSFQTVFRNSESYDDVVDDKVSVTIKDEAKPSSPEDKNEAIVAKEDEKEIKDKEYIQ